MVVISGRDCKGCLDAAWLGWDVNLFSQFYFPVGPMLLAERLTRVYGRTDGGPGAALAVDGGELVSHNAPKPETPCRWWNMAFPILMLVFYIFYLLWWTGKQSAAPGASFLEIIEQSNSYQGLLWGTMAASLTGLAFYFIQDHKDDRIIWLNCKGYLSRAKRIVSRMKAFCRRGQQEEEEDDEGDHAQILMDYRTAMAAFLIGSELTNVTLRVFMEKLDSTSRSGEDLRVRVPCSCAMSVFMHVTDFIQESNNTYGSAMVSISVVCTLLVFVTHHTLVCFAQVVLTLAWATGASKYAAFASGR